MKPVPGDTIERQISVVTASAAFLVFAFFMMREYVIDETHQRLLEIGMSWLPATVLFEFGFGQHGNGKSWGALPHDYNIFAGRRWPVVLAVEFVAPIVTERIAGRDFGSPSAPRPHLHLSAQSWVSPDV